MSTQAYRAALIRKVEEMMDREQSFMLPEHPHAHVNLFAEGRHDALVDVMWLLKEPDL